MSKRRVFVLNDGGHDYREAERFGEIVVCSEGIIPKNDIHRMYRLLSPHLMDADKNDLILISSLASLCSVATAIMAANHGEVHFLVFANGQYFIQDIVVD